MAFILDWAKKNEWYSFLLLNLILLPPEEGEAEHGDNNNFSHAVAKQFSSILLFGLLFALNMNS